jgi:hypothetical protein
VDEVALEDDEEEVVEATDEIEEDVEDGEER